MRLLTKKKPPRSSGLHPESVMRLSREGRCPVPSRSEGGGDQPCASRFEAHLSEQPIAVHDALSV